MDITYHDWGLATWCEGKIRLNKNLKKYPRLHAYILRHEKGHSENFDLLHEFNINPKYDFLLFLFCLRYPKTLVDLSPIKIRDSAIIYDLNKIILYGMVIVLLISLKIIY